MGERTARCSCGSLTATVQGEPLEVYLCTCSNCQRQSGGVSTYCAIFPETAVSIAGAQTRWRHLGVSGRWIETAFCPTCGSTVLARIEGRPGVIGVSAGCFADPNFAQPERVYWASQQHRWLTLPEGTQLIATQPD